MYFPAMRETSPRNIQHFVRRLLDVRDALSTERLRKTIGRLCRSEAGLLLVPEINRPYTQGRGCGPVWENISGAVRESVGNILIVRNLFLPLFIAYGIRYVEFQKYYWRRV